MRRGVACGDFGSIETLERLRQFKPLRGDNYWTDERLHGGATITVDAPIDILPLFVRAGSIVPLGSEVQSAQQSQMVASVRVYPGADGTFTLFRDDGKAYAYENGGGSLTKVVWDDAAHQLKHEGAPGWNRPDQCSGNIA